ncbi:MAG: hypothetical protein ACOY0T_14720 [Myxococcota bacterium]
MGSVLRACVLLAAVAVACGGPTFILQQYDGPARSAESVAIVRFEGTADVDLVTLDGAVADAHVPEDARLHVEMLPGRHVLGVARRGAPGEQVRRVVFVAEPARTYQIVFGAPAANEWQPSLRVFEIDFRSGRQLRDVTYTPPARDVAPASAVSSAAPAPPATVPSVSAPPPLDTTGAAGARAD